MTPLHWIGKILYDILSILPLSLVHAIFIAIPAVLIIWVLKLPREITAFPGSEKQPFWYDLKFWASIALSMQLLIYSLL